MKPELVSSLKKQRMVDRIDVICDAFETEWLAGRRPNVKDYVPESGEIDRPKLITELALIDVEYRANLGETPDQDEILGLFPEYADQLRAAVIARAQGESEKPVGHIAATGSLRSVETQRRERQLDNGEYVDNKVQGNLENLEIPGYEILETLGRGGMGQVFRARQLELNREVALKLILMGQFASDEQRMRFRLEAETVAALEHQNIVHLFDAGEAHSQPYLALELVSGPSLEDRLENNAFSYHEAVALMEKLARAIHVAHQRGIVHRDLKPANILFTPEGDPKITDFGLAKRLTDQPTQTRPGSLLGTPRYMAPEQAGAAGTVGPPTDVYALGVILYELLTNEPVYQTESLWDIIEKIKHEDVRPLRSVRHDIPRDLETICLKCLHKSTTDRYASAEHLADDLKRFRESRPILARDVGLVEKMVLWTRRRPLVAGLLSIVVALGVISVVGGVWYQVRLQQEHTRAERRFELASQAVDRMIAELGDEQQIIDPGHEQRRQATLQQALEFCQALAMEEPDDPGAQRRLGFAQRRLGDIHRMLGDHSSAQKAYSRSSELLRALIVTQANDDEVKRQLATAHNYFGELYRIAGEDSKARSEYERARLLQQQLVSKSNRHEDIANLARSHYNLALIEKNNSQLNASRELLQQAQQLVEPLIALPDPPSSFQQHMARTNVNLGSVLRMLDEPNEASVAYTQAIQIFKRLVASNPDYSEYRYEMALAYNNYGNLLMRSDTKRATENLQASRDLLEQLTRDYPLVPIYRHELANTYNGWATLAAIDGQLDTASQAWSKAVDLLRPVAHADSAAQSTRADLGIYLSNLGRLKLMQDDLGAAETHLREALKALAPELDGHPNHPVYRASAFKACVDLASLSVQQRQFDLVAMRVSWINGLFKDPDMARLTKLVFLSRCLRDLEGLDDFTTDQHAKWRDHYVDAALPDFHRVKDHPELASFVRSSGYFRALREIAGERISTSAVGK